MLLLLLCLPLPEDARSPDAYTPSGRTADAEPTTVKPGSVNINTATLDELDALPGIGPTIAQAIIDERETNGPFCYPEDLMHAKGIGKKRLQDIYDDITVGE